MVTTVRDAVDQLNDSWGQSPSGGAQRKIYRAIEAAYRELADASQWSYLQTQSRITTVAPYSTGTVEYTHSSRTLTLTGGTFPSWAAFGVVRISNVLYRVASMTDGNNLVLSTDSNPGANVASGTAYSIFREAFPLPADFRALGELQRPNFLPELCYLSASRWQKERQAYVQVGTPTSYSVFGDPWNPGGLALFFAPAPDVADTYDFLYLRRPRALVVRDEYAGTASVSASGTTVTGVGTAFTAAMVGSIFRFSANSTSTPSGFGGDNPAALESRITAVASATSLTIEDAAPAAYSSVKFMISDPLDLTDGSMLNAFYRCAEMHLALNGPQTAEQRNLTTQAYARSLILAKEADSRSIAPRSAGSGGTVYPNYRVGADQS